MIDATGAWAWATFPVVLCESFWLNAIYEARSIKDTKVYTHILLFKASHMQKRYLSFNTLEAFTVSKNDAHINVSNIRNMEHQVKETAFWLLICKM